MIKNKFLFLLILCSVFVGTCRLEARGLESAASQSQVTAGEYCLFLNTIAMTDADGLYDEKIDNIERSGEPGGYCYTVLEGKKIDEIAYIDQKSAMIYCYWLENTASTSTFNFNYCNVVSDHVAVCDEQLQSNRLSLYRINASETSALTEKSMEKKTTGAVETAMKLLTFGAVVFGGSAVGREENFLNEDHEANVRRGNEGGRHEEVRTLIPQQQEQTASIIENNNSCQRKGILYKNEKMHISAHSDDLVYNFNPDEFSEEKEDAHDSLDITATIHQTTPSNNSKPLPSSEVMTMREGIKKIESQPGKKVAFDFFSEAGITETSSSSSGSKHVEKRPLLGSRKLKELTSGIEMAIDDIPEGASDKAAQVAAIYAAAYPRIKTQLEGLLSTIKNDVALQTDKNAIVLANTAIELVNAAFNAVNLETVRSIKIADNPNNSVVVEKKIPSVIVPYGNIESSDFEAIATILNGDHMIKSFQESVAAFKSADEEAGKALFKSQGQSAARAEVVAFKKYCARDYARNVLLRNSVSETSSEFTQAMSEKKRAYDYWKECSDTTILRYKSTPITDPVEARKRAVADILGMAENALEGADQVKAMFISRAVQH